MKTFVQIFLLAILFLSSVCVAQVVGPSSSTTPLGSPAQNKSFVEETTQTVFQFYHDGSQIVAKSSQDAETWVPAATLSYNTSDFFILYQNSTVLVFIADSDDILVRSGVVSNDSISFAAEQLVFDGTGEFDSYSKPSAAVLADGSVILAAVWNYSELVADSYTAVVSTAPNLSVSTFSAPVRVGLPHKEIKNLSLVSSDTFGVRLSTHNDEDEINVYERVIGNWTELKTGADYEYSEIGHRAFYFYPQISEIYNGELYLGGLFQNGAGIKDADGLIKFDGEKFSSLGFPSFTPSDFAVFNGELYIATSETDIGGDTSLDYLVKFDGTSLQSAGFSLGARVRSLHVHDNKLFIGGDFVDVGGDLDADYLVQFDGSSVSSVSAGMTGYVDRMESFAGDLYFSGAFLDTAGVADADYIAKYDGTAVSSLGVSLTNVISSMASYNGYLYIGGYFTAVGGDPNFSYLVRYDGVNYDPFAPGFFGGPFSMEVFDGKLYMSGNIFYAAESAFYFFGFDGTNYHQPSPFLIVAFGYDMIEFQEKLYVVGFFYDVGGVTTADNIFTFDGTNAAAVISNIAPTISNVSEGEEFSGETYYLANINGSSSRSLVTIKDGLVESSVDLGPGGFNLLKTFNGQLYVGGNFLNFQGDMAADYIVRYDGTSFSNLGGTINGLVSDLEVYGGELYISGNFTDAGGVAAADRLALYDGTSFSAFPHSFSALSGFAIYQGDLYFLGNFENLSGNPDADYIARYDGTSIFDLGTNLNGAVFAGATANDGRLYFVGSFTDVGGDVASDYAASYDGTSVVGFQGLVDSSGSNLFSSVTSFEDKLFFSNQRNLFVYEGTFITDLSYLDFSQLYSPAIVEDELYINDFNSPIIYKRVPVVSEAFSSRFSSAGNLDIFHSAETNKVKASTFSGSWSVNAGTAVGEIDSIRAASSGQLFITEDNFISFLADSGSTEPIDNGVLVGALDHVEWSAGVVFAYSKNGQIISGDLSNSLDEDWDNDGLSFADEILNGSSAYDSDSDNDGALDGAEVAAGSNPLLADTEGDGIDDNSEITLGLNPNAYEYPFSSPGYLGWNSFQGMTNVLELSNRSNSFQSVEVGVLNSNGANVIKFFVGLEPSQKKDILLDAFLPEDAYGSIKLVFTSHSLRARTVQYSGDSVSFAYHIEGRDSLVGESFVLFNNIDPSIQKDLKVENWLSITNTSNSSDFFTASKYDVNGNLIEVQGVSISPGGRMDFNGGVDSEKAGLVSIVSNNPATTYLANLVRQGYDENFVYQFGVSLDFRKGSDDAFASLSDNSYIELANVCDHAAGLTLSVYESDGTTSLKNFYSLDSKAHIHIPNEALGYAQASSDDSCVLMSALRYQGDTTGLSVSEEQVPRNGVVEGRYNTFLGQSVKLLVTNTSDSSQSYSVTYKDADGGESSESIVLEGNQTRESALLVSADSYGVVEVSGSEMISALTVSSETFADSFECR